MGDADKAVIPAKAGNWLDFSAKQQDPGFRRDDIGVLVQVPNENDDVMAHLFHQLHKSLMSKLILAVGLTLLVSIAVWAYFNIRYQNNKLTQHVLNETARFSNTIKLGTHYAMMTNARDDINQIILNIARQKEIETIRIYNKAGQIKFSNQLQEVDHTTNIKAEACDVCHRWDPPLEHLSPEQGRRYFTNPAGQQVMGVITPILNEPGCSEACHVHPLDKKVLGALDVVFSLETVQAEMQRFKRGILILAAFVFLVTSAIIMVVMLRFVNRPIRRLIDETKLIAEGDYVTKVPVDGEDEINQLAMAVNRMGDEIARSQSELRRQRNEYQNLFENVPCEIAVLDRDYRLVNFNRNYVDKFNPVRGDYCYQAYKGRDTKCRDCLVEKTFEGQGPQLGEETGYDKNGRPVHWLVVTSPLVNDDGRITGAMEMNLDLTDRKVLEDKLRQSEMKYQAFFNNIPNPVFVLDAETLDIRDCNDSVKAVYEFDKSAILGMSFLNFFVDEEKKAYAVAIPTSKVLNRVKQIKKSGIPLFVNIRISPSDDDGQKVFLVTTSDITKRLEAEQQLIQASKMATLGEMATGVAHELNQPLSVIKTAGSYLMKKVRNKEPIADDIMLTMTEEIDSHINRATKIITHMREFGRKSDLDIVPVQLNEVIQRAFEIFSQQLKVRGIDVQWDLADNLPPIEADPSCLEQVFINLLINARDAIEAAWEAGAQPPLEDAGPSRPKEIHIRTRCAKEGVMAEVTDSGGGIPEAIREKIFEPFFTTKEVGKGTGLGLSISYGIVKDCRGDIRAESVPGRGARFIITFPAACLEREDRTIIARETLGKAKATPG
jgi:histidine kinase